MSRRRRSRSRAAPRPRALPGRRILVFAAIGLALAAIALAFLLRGGDPASAYARAAQHAAAGDLRSARVEAMNAVEHDPGNAEAWLLLARTQIALDDPQSALATVERAREAGIAAGATRPLMAEAALDLGDVDTALAETAADDIPAERLADAARVRGRAFAMRGDPETAAEAFGIALAQDEDDPALWIDLARFRIGTGDLAGAIEAADRAVALAPRSTEALVLKGRLVRRQYGFVASLAWFDRAIEIDEADIEARLERAATLGEVGRTTEMLAETRRVLELDSNNAEARYLQAVLAARARDFDLARRLVELTGGALEGEPAMMLLEAAIDHRQGNHESAVRRLEALVALQPDNFTALRLLGAARFAAGDMRGVVRALSPLVARGDADSYALTLAGRALERLGERERAAGYLGRAALAAGDAGGPLGTGEGDVAALEAAARSGGAAAEAALIRAYLASGRRGDALARARRLRDANPGAAAAHLLYGDALGAAGEFGAAAAAYASAANIHFSEPAALRLVEALGRAGQPAEAMRTLALFREQNPRNVSAARLDARLSLGAGQWERAAAILENVRARIGDRDAALLANLALARHEMGDNERAVALARRAYRLLPMNPATSATYGWVLFDGGGDPRLGRELLEKAARLAPDDPRIRERLAELSAAG